MGEPSDYESKNIEKELRDEEREKKKKDKEEKGWDKIDREMKKKGAIGPFGHIKEWEEFNEGVSEFKNLQIFMNDLLKAFNTTAEESSGILLDVVGGFGWKKETVWVDLGTLAEESKMPIGEVMKKVNAIFNVHKDKI